MISIGPHTFSVLLSCQFVRTRSSELCGCGELFSGCGWSGRVCVLESGLHSVYGRQPTQHFLSTVCRTERYECQLYRTELKRRIENSYNLPTPFERSLSKLPENYKIVNIGSTEFKLWQLKESPSH